MRLHGAIREFGLTRRDDGPVSYWEQLERPAPGRRDRRRRRAAPPQPRAPAAQARADVFDLALDGKAAIVEEVVREHGRRRAARGDGRGRPRARPRRGSPDRPPLLLRAGRGRAAGRRRARRRRGCASSSPGIGNVFIGDDGFGVEVVEPPRAQQAAGRRGRRGLRHPRHGPRLRARGTTTSRSSWTRSRAAARPGTLYLIEPELDDDGCRARRARHGPGEGAGARARAGRPAAARAGRGLRAGAGAHAARTTLVAELSEPVRAALDEAVRMVELAGRSVTTSERSRCHEQGAIVAYWQHGAAVCRLKRTEVRSM